MGHQLSPAMPHIAVLHTGATLHTEERQIGVSESKRRVDWAHSRGQREEPRSPETGQRAPYPWEWGAAELGMLLGLGLGMLSRLGMRMGIPLGLELRMLWGMGILWGMRLGMPSRLGMPLVIVMAMAMDGLIPILVGVVGRSPLETLERVVHLGCG